jgi:hypothetical protein
MRRTILYFLLGTVCTALFSAAISVYVFHDVDHDKLGHWNEVFAGLAAEVVLFALIMTGGVALLTLLGRRVWHLKGYSPSAKLGFFLGIGVSVVQYLWDFAGRTVFPKLADSSLGLYLIVAVALCSVLIVRDNFKQMKLSQGPEAPLSSYTPEKRGYR